VGGIWVGGPEETGGIEGEAAASEGIGARAGITGGGTVPIEGGRCEARCRSGKAISGVGPRQSFQVNVTSGGLGGRPLKATSKTARFRNFPGGAAQSCCAMSAQSLRNSISASSSAVPGATV
jgi:hypothetical protein